MRHTDPVLFGLCARLAHGSPTRCLRLRLAFGAPVVLALLGAAYFVVHAGPCWSGTYWGTRSSIVLLALGALASVLYLASAPFVAWRHRRPHS